MTHTPHQHTASIVFLPPVRPEQHRNISPPATHASTLSKPSRHRSKHRYLAIRYSEAQRTIGRPVDRMIVCFYRSAILVFPIPTPYPHGRSRTRERSCLKHRQAAALRVEAVVQFQVHT